MTMWSPPRVAAFCKNAGFVDDDLITAIALVFATSGGQDAYVSKLDVTPPTWYLGLMGVPSPGGPDTPIGSLLFDPRYNCSQALIQSETGQGFGWSPVWRQGLQSWQRRAAEIALKMSVGTMPDDWAPNAEPAMQARQQTLGSVQQLGQASTFLGNASQGLP